MLDIGVDLLKPGSDDFRAVLANLGLCDEKVVLQVSFSDFRVINDREASDTYQILKRKEG